MKLLTLARDLQRRKARDRHGLFVGEGVRVVEELARSSIRVRGVLHTAEAAESGRCATLLDAFRDAGTDVVEIPERDFITAAETDSPQGVLAIAEVPDRGLASLPLSPRIRLLVLDAVQDPGNVGTILRTAAALGATATVALPGTVDLWNAKVVRSAMGAHFHHPAFSSTLEELDGFCRQQDVAVWAADASGEPLESLSPPSRLALVMGNEGAGITAAIRARTDHLVALPIAAAVESLNVAVAAGILLHALRR